MRGSAAADDGKVQRVPFAFRRTSCYAMNDNAEGTMKNAREANPGQVRFWTIVLILTWGTLAALLALHFAGVV